MSDIRKCWDCGEDFYMDNGTRCSICDEEFCGACDLDNTIWISTKDGIITLCLDCIREYKENGIEWLREELYTESDDFDEQDLIDAIKELEERLDKEI